MRRISGFFLGLIVNKIGGIIFSSQRAMKKWVKSNGPVHSYEKNGDWEWEKKGRNCNGRFYGTITLTWPSSDGQLKTEWNCQNGELSGCCKEFYPDGQLKIEANYQNGELSGCCKEFYPDGQLKIEANYQNGELDGHTRRWYKDGTLVGHYICEQDEVLRIVIE